MTVPGDQALQIDGLRVVFGDFVAIPGLSFLVNYGEVHGIIGPNGAGKTTLLDAITGKTRPAEGKIVLDRRIDLLALDEPERALAGVGRKFQKPSVFQALSVRENLGLALRLHAGSLLAELRHWGDARRGERCDEVLEEIGLADLADRPAGTLAHGQKQWLEIGMLLMQRPKLLMLDEPVAGMNRIETERTAELIGQLRAPERAILVIEHDMDFVETVADRVTVLHGGEPIFAGRMADARRDARVREVYLGR
ncbi:MAG: ABC transporter ATP-binding protein [Thioclava sp.]|nr:ABC transporter ATP-binding protein [Thioclava sp.]